MPKNPCGIRIERKRATKKGQPELVLFIRGHQVGASQKQTALLACLPKNHGHIVSYEQLIQVLGHKFFGRPQLHILRQYVLWVSKILAVRKALGT
jgi:DNA-binding winged helix-turn-helix (wHTH) protein